MTGVVTQTDPIRSHLHKFSPNLLISAYRNLYVNIYCCFSEISSVTG